MATQIEERTAHQRPEKPRRTGMWLVLALIAIVAVTLGIVVATSGDDGADEATATTLTTTTAASATTPAPAPAVPGTPEYVMEGLAATVVALEDVAIDELAVPLEGPGRDFLEWNVALGMEPVLSNCRANAPDRTVFSVTCDVAMGEDYFFTKTAGAVATTTVTMRIDTGSGELTVSSWPAPPGLVPTENDFRDWIRATHPDLEERMFGNDYANVVEFSKEAGELHTQYLNEYLASLAGEPTPVGVMQTLIAAVLEVDEVTVTELDYPYQDLGRRFLEWNLALGMEPEMSGCRRDNPDNPLVWVTCDVTMGENYFFSRTAGEVATTTVTVRIDPENGELFVTSWPAPVGLGLVENDMREWIRANHPELEDRMFGNDYAGVVQFSAEAGELHTEYLNEYLASLAGEPTPVGVLQTLIAAVLDLDEIAADQLDYTYDAFGRRFLEWNLALGMEPVLSGCRAFNTGPDVSTVTCDVAMGEDYFFSRTAGEEAVTTVSMLADEGRGLLDVVSWPAPAGLVETERDVREWIKENYPDLEDRMFGNDYAGVVEFSREAGELHTRYLDEYLASRS